MHQIAPPSGDDACSVEDGAKYPNWRNSVGSRPHRWREAFAALIRSKRLGTVEATQACLGETLDHAGGIRGLARVRTGRARASTVSRCWSSVTTRRDCNNTLPTGQPAAECCDWPVQMLRHGRSHVGDIRQNLTVFSPLLQNSLGGTHGWDRRLLRRYASVASDHGSRRARSASVIWFTSVSVRHRNWCTGIGDSLHAIQLRHTRRTLVRSLCVKKGRSCPQNTA